VNPFSYKEFDLRQNEQYAVLESILPYQAGWIFKGGPEGSSLFASMPGPSTIPTAELNNRVIKKAKGQQWNAPIFLAEARKTHSMVIARAEHLAEMAYDLRRGRIADFFQKFHKSVIPPGRAATKRFNNNYGRNAAGAAGNAWLEYSYGWSPFVKDVRDAMNTLMDLSDRPASHEVTVASTLKRESVVDDLLGQVIWQYPTLGLYAYGHRRTTLQSKFRVKWKIKARPLDLPARLGLLNPLEVAWELVPFSFVADWFLPIGDYFASLDVNVRFEHINGSYGERSQVTIETIPDDGTHSAFGGVCKTLYVGRSSMTVAPSVELKLKNWGFDPKAPRLASSVALLSQQMSRLRLMESVRRPTRPGRQFRRWEQWAHF
jgi:hypothetical protein